MLTNRFLAQNNLKVSFVIGLKYLSYISILYSTAISAVYLYLITFLFYFTMHISTKV